MKNKIALLALATLLLAGCGGRTDDTSSVTSEISYDPELQVTVNFYVDYNAILIDEVYYTTKVTNLEKITDVPEDPLEAPYPEFPVFKGWSTHQVIDDLKYLWDFNTDVVQVRSNTLDLFGIWMAEGE